MSAFIFVHFGILDMESTKVNVGTPPPYNPVPSKNPVESDVYPVSETLYMFLRC